MVCIFGLMTKTSSKHNNANDYDEIVNLVGGCGTIPGELVVEILSKLPVKSLIRFKRVCKPWKLLINSPIFIDIHLHRKNPQILKYYRGMGEDVLFSVNTCYIVGVHNGIVCLETAYPCHKKPLLLCNPSTREFSFLPAECKGDFYGFCYNSQTQKYHVISFSYQCDDSRMVNIKFLTLGKMLLFRDVKDVIVPGRIEEAVQVTSGTSLFWPGEDYDNDDNYTVIRFDVIEERFSLMDVPTSPPCLFQGVKDSVFMLNYEEMEPTSFDMWMLIDDASKGKRWMKYRKVGPFGPGVTMIPIDVCWSGKRIRCCKNFNTDDEQIVHYNLETNQVEDFEAIHPPRHCANYVESLVPINSLLPCIDTDW